MIKAIRVIGFTAAAGLILWGCSAVDYFGEYSGESFLTRSSFVDDSWELMPHYSFESGTSASDYMDYTLDSATGGPNGGASYRLEIKNLLANGDFEDGDADEWYHFDTSNITQPATGSGEVTLDYVDATSPQTMSDSHFLYFDLTNDYRCGIIFNDTSNTYTDAFVNPDTYISDMSYVFSYRYRTITLTSYYQKDWDGSYTSADTQEYQALGGTDGSANSRSEDNYNYFPPLDPDEIVDSTDSEGNYNISYNVITADNNTDMDSYFFSTNGYIDDVTFVRDSKGDFDLRLRLKMDIDHNSDLDLIPGYYRFSVYVKAENSGVNNVFEADRVELGINGYDEDNNISYEGTQVFYKTSTLHDLYSQSGESFQGDWSSDWVQLVFETDQTVQLPDISEDPVLELTISPSNPGTSDASWNRLDAGSILIAEPSLEYSDGPWD